MKRLIGYFSLIILALGLVVQPLQARVKLGVDVLGRVQNLESRDQENSINPKEAAGFGNVRANLHVFGDVAQGIEVYMESHVNPAPVQSGSTDNFSQTPSDTSLMNEASDNFIFKQAYVRFTDLNPSFDLTAGEFEVDYGHNQIHRTDNGEAMRNPLVGNYLVDPVAVQSGIELSGHTERYAWGIGVTNGSGNYRNALGGNDQFVQNSNFGYNAKVWGNLSPSFLGSLSYYQSNQLQAIKEAGNSRSFISIGKASPRRVHTNASNLFGSMNPAGIYQGMQVEASPIMGAFANGGANVKAWQVDLDYKTTYPGPSAEVSYGIYEDNGIGELYDRGIRTVPQDIANAAEVGADTGAYASDQEWEYWGVQFKYPFTPMTYVAGRWSTANGDISGVSTNLKYEKLQFGVGQKYNENTLLKIEWVNQSVKEAPDALSPVINDTQKFSGYLAELSVQF